MKKFICYFILSFFATSLSAQLPTAYPESVRKAFEAADLQAYPGNPRKAVIAIPVSSAGASYSLETASAGGVAVFVDTGMDDYDAMRDLCASIDGFIIDDAFASSPNPLLLKALAERNVPMLGTCGLLTEINAGLKRLPDNLNDVAQLVRKAETYKKAKQIMSRVLVVDTHCDLPMLLVKDSRLGVRGYNQVSLQKMEEGGQSVAFLASFLGQKPVSRESLSKAVKDAHKMLAATLRNIEENSAFCAQAWNVEDALKIKSQGKKAIFLCIENGFALGDDISRVEEYARMGVAYMTLCHSRDNSLCGTSNPASTSNNAGLTEFGRKVVAEMNRCGMMIDLSHASEQTFYDVVAISKAPIICTHSGAKALFFHNRSLTDDQLRALSRNGGVIQQYFVPYFMNKDEDKASIEDVIAQLKHCVEVAGIDHVGLGGDFDGGGGGPGFNGCNDYVNICTRLIEEGFSDDDIAKILGGNVMRVLSEVQAIGEIKPYEH